MANVKLPLMMALTRTDVVQSGVYFMRQRFDPLRLAFKVQVSGWSAGNLIETLSTWALNYEYNHGPFKHAFKNV